MGYSNKENDYWKDQSLAVDADGDEIDVRYVTRGAIQISWSGASATDAVVKAQESVNGTGWEDISGKTVTIGAASGSDIWKFTADELACPRIRLVVSNGTETTGIATVTYFFKGDR